MRQTPSKGGVLPTACFRGQPVVPSGDTALRGAGVHGLQPAPPQWVSTVSACRGPPGAGCPCAVAWLQSMTREGHLWDPPRPVRYLPAQHAGMTVCERALCSPALPWHSPPPQQLRVAGPAWVQAQEASPRLGAAPAQRQLSQHGAYHAGKLVAVPGARAAQHHLRTPGARAALCCAVLHCSYI